MRIAETVTFGGSGFDRAAGLRGKPDRIANLLSEPSCRVLPVWRGRPLLDASGDALGWMPAIHPVLPAQTAYIFLGIDEGTALFAADLSAWLPAGFDPSKPAGFFDSDLQHHPALPDGTGFGDLRSVMARLTRRDAELAATAKAILGWHETHGFCARCGVPSAMAMAGWQRNCPACGGQHFPRTDPVVIMLITHGNSLLIGRSPGWPEGMFSLLAGFIEPGETIEAAVRREVMEETGVPVGSVRYLASQPWPFPASLMMGCQGEASGREITIDPAEIEQALWITREEMMQVMAGAHPFIKPSRRGAIAHFLITSWLADQLE